MLGLLGYKREALRQHVGFIIMRGAVRLSSSAPLKF